MAIVYGVSNDYLINSPGISTSTQKYSLWAKARKDGNRFLNPSLDLDFAGNKSLIDNVSGSNLVTFSRSSNATVLNADGLVGIASTNTPRFDHDSITRECRGLLIEEQRINYASQSLVAVNSTLVSSNDTTYNVGTDVTTIHKFTLGTAGIQFSIPIFFAPGQASVGQIDIISFYMRSDSPLTVSVVFTGGPESSGILFSNGSVAVFSSSVTTQVGPSGFTRYIISIVSLGTNGNNVSSARITLSGTLGTNYYIFGCQWESRVSFPTSYIPTSGSQVTRTADQVSITGSNFTRWYPSSGGSIYVSATPTNISQDRTNIVAIGNSTLTNYSALISTLPGSRGAQFRSRNSGTPQADIVSVGSTLSKTSICANFTPSNFAVDSNSSGIAVTTSGIGTLGTSDRVQIGILAANSGQYSGTIERITVFPETLPSTAVSLVASASPAPAGIGTNQIVLMVRMTGAGTYTLRTNNTGTYNYTVNWGDGTSTTHTTNNPTKTYSSPGVYRVTVTQNSGSFTFYHVAASTDAVRVTSIVGAGSSFVWGSSFIWGWEGCSSMVLFPPINTSSVTNILGAWRNCSSLTSFPLIDTSSATTMQLSWSECSGLTAFPTINLSNTTSLLDTWSGCGGLRSFPLLTLPASLTDLTRTWASCTGLTTFPLINTSNITNFGNTWGGCTGLTTFPQIDTSNATSISNAWNGCTSLVSMGASLNTSNCTSFSLTWINNTSLISLPTLDTSNGSNFNLICYNCTSLKSFSGTSFQKATNCSQAWYQSGITTFSATVGFGTLVTNLSQTWSNTPLTTFPANMFDNCTYTDFSSAFSACALTAQSIENILVSINTSNTSNGTLTLSGGSNANTSTWSATANTAYLALKSRGWTITQNGTAPT